MVRKLLSAFCILALSTVVLCAAGGCRRESARPPVKEPTPARPLPLRASTPEPAPAVDAPPAPNEKATPSHQQASTFQQILQNDKLTREQRIQALLDLGPSALTIARDTGEATYTPRTKTQTAETARAMVASTESAGQDVRGPALIDSQANPDEATASVGGAIAEYAPVYVVRQGYPLHAYDLNRHRRAGQAHRRAHHRRPHLHDTPSRAPERRSSINGAARSGPINGAAKIPR